MEGSNKNQSNCSLKANPKLKHINNKHCPNFSWALTTVRHQPSLCCLLSSVSLRNSPLMPTLKFPWHSFVLLPHSQVLQAQAEVALPIAATRKWRSCPYLSLKALFSLSLLFRRWTEVQVQCTTHTSFMQEHTTFNFFTEIITQSLFSSDLLQPRLCLAQTYVSPEQPRNCGNNLSLPIRELNWRQLQFSI